jgi:VWFA-related protein
MRRVSLLLVALAALAGQAPLAAESRPVAIVVTDASGAFVPDLRAEEVVLLENGAPRPIERFERDERPLAAYLVLDTSTGAADAFRSEAFDSVWRFLERLPKGSECVLWSTGERPRRMGTLEGPRPGVEKKVAQAFAIEGPNALMDTLVEAGTALARESGRRRALVVLSGRGAGHTVATPADVTTRTRKASAPVFALMYGQGETGGVGSLLLGDSPRDAQNITVVGPGDHQRILTSLAQSTGGRFETTASALGAKSAFLSLSSELGGQYRIRYAQAEGEGPRRVEVRVARPGVHWRVVVDSP